MQTIIQFAQTTEETIDAIVVELVRIALDNVLRSLGL
jgi:hypothetical protein